jgi:hypothetical protein
MYSILNNLCLILKCFQVMISIILYWTLGNFKKHCCFPLGFENVIEYDMFVPFSIFSYWEMFMKIFSATYFNHFDLPQQVSTHTHSQKVAFSFLCYRSNLYNAIKLDIYCFQLSWFLAAWIILFSTLMVCCIFMRRTTDTGKRDGWRWYVRHESGRDKLGDEKTNYLITGLSRKIKMLI